METRAPSHVVLLIGNQLVDSPAERAVFIPPYGFSDYYARHDPLCQLSEEEALSSIVVYPYQVPGSDAASLSVAGVDLQSRVPLDLPQPIGHPKGGIEEVMGRGGDAVERIPCSFLHGFKALPDWDMGRHWGKALPGQGLRIKLRLSGRGGKSIFEGEERLRQIEP